MKNSYLFLLLLAFCSAHSVLGNCTKPSLTTFTLHGVRASKLCSGQLIFHENFNTLDTKRWKHEVSLTGFGNGEFEYYTNDRRVSYVKNSILHIQPKLLSSDKGNDFLYHGTIDLGKACTNNDDSGCKRTGRPGSILNPVLSAKLTTMNSFSFRYGRLEVRLKVPAGDWLWPAFWLLPRDWKYGGWPVSGEIDLMESRGNENLGYPYQAASTLHWGPDRNHNQFLRTHYEKGDKAGYHKAFHTFKLEWTPNHMMFYINNQRFGTVAPPAGGFWQLGDLAKSGLKNPWAHSSKMAPFDKEFYIIINLAIGGTSGFFPESKGKPWKNGGNRFEAMTKFWEGRNQWLNSWKMGTEKSHFEIDDIKVWAL